MLMLKNICMQIYINLYKQINSNEYKDFKSKLGFILRFQQFSYKI